MFFRRRLTTISVLHDYRDWTFVHMMAQRSLPFQVLTPGTLQVAHIGLDGGMHPPNSAQANLIERNRNTVKFGAFHGKPSSVRPYTSKNTRLVHKGNGGWGHPADHEHCLTLFKEPTIAS